MDEEAKLKKRQQAEARRKRILERGGARLSTITGETGFLREDATHAAEAAEVEISRPQSAISPASIPTKNNVPEQGPPSTTPSYCAQQQDPHENSDANLPPPSNEIPLISNHESEIKSKLKSLVVPKVGAEGIFLPKANTFRLLGLVFDYTRVFQIFTAIILGVAAAIGVDYGVSPFLGLLFAEALVVGGGWYFVSMNPTFLDDLVQRRKMLNQVTMKEGGGIIPSVFYSIPTLRDVLATVEDLRGVVKGLSEDVSIFVVVAGVVSEMNAR